MQLVRPPLRVFVWATATVVLLLVATLLWRGSDAAATDSTTASPADVPPGTPAGAVSEAWSADGGPLAEAVESRTASPARLRLFVHARTPVPASRATASSQRSAVANTATATPFVAVSPHRRALLRV